MKHALITLIMIVVACTLMGAVYYVNIYYAPNDNASGIMKVYVEGNSFPIAQAYIQWVANIGDDIGGRYVAEGLPSASATTPITVVCTCRRNDNPMKTDSCSNHFTNWSSPPFNVGTCDLRDWVPSTPPTDPSGT